jgi:hypothetical protein
MTFAYIFRDIKSGGENYWDLSEHGEKRNAFRIFYVET